MTGLLTAPPKGVLGGSPNRIFAQPKSQPVAAHSGRGLLAALISLPGMGKSSLLAQFPNAQFICDSRDQGILTLMDYANQTNVHISQKPMICGDYNSLKNNLTIAAEGDAPVIVLESMVGIQAICDTLCLIEDFEDKINTFVNYQNGFVASANRYFQPLLDIMIRAQNNGKICWLTGHTKVGSGKNISGEDWVSQVTESSPAFARRVQATFDNIFHIGSTISTNKISGKVRASGMHTSIYTDINPFFPAKNRMGLHEAIPYPPSAPEAYVALCNALRIDPKTLRRT